MIVTTILALFFSWSQSADKGVGPLLSATDPAYLSCTVWTGKEWTKPSAHSAKTPLIQSAKGVRAFAEVKVDSSCRNTMTLYIASGVEQKFRIVYTKLPSARDGNGIHIIGWSPSGEKLLAEVNLWEYETDLGFDQVALITMPTQVRQRKFRL